MHVLRRLGQLAVDRAGERVDELRPARVPDPQRAAALAAEAALALALLAVDPGVEPGDELLAAHLQALGVGAEIDGVAATAGGLAADRAVAAHVGGGRVGLDLELHRAAVAGAFQLHGSLHTGTSADQAARCRLI